MNPTQNQPIQLQSLQLKNIAQFENFTIKFGEKLNPKKANVHIVTGPNGSGKTTILKGVFVKKSSFFIHPTYSFNFFDLLMHLTVQTENKIHRDTCFFYTPGNPISANDKRILSEYNRNNSGASGTYFPWVPEYPTTDYLQYISKLEDRRNAMVADQFRTDDEKHLSVEQVAEIKSEVTFTEKLEEAVRYILDEKDFKFKYKNLEEGYVPFVNGQFYAFDELSLGYHQIISLFTDILMKVWVHSKNLENRNELPFILLLDEIEVHLHPHAQRRILPALQRLFPNAEIVCSTHSPFIVNSIDDAWVYELHEENYQKADDRLVLKPRKVTILEDTSTILSEDFNLDGEYSPKGEKEL